FTFIYFKTLLISRLVLFIRVFFKNYFSPIRANKTIIFFTILPVFGILNILFVFTCLFFKIGSVRYEKLKSGFFLFSYSVYIILFTSIARISYDSFRHW